MKWLIFLAVIIERPLIFRQINHDLAVKILMYCSVQITVMPPGDIPTGRGAVILFTNIKHLACFFPGG